MKNLDFNRAHWAEVQAELGEVDWSDMEEAAKASPSQALSLFMGNLIPILEKNVPMRQKKKKIGTDWRKKESFFGGDWGG